MTRSTDNRWLHRFALLTAVATLGLIGVGGLVTSHGAGMAVPDWPTTYGENMFLFPVSQWVGGIFYEHTHRLYASGVGLLTTILAVWLWMKESRAWLRWLGVLAFFLVAFQGVLGGLRVTMFKDEIGIFHATIAQLFLVLVSAIALFTSRWWVQNTAQMGRLATGSFRHLVLATTALILLQLILGATMRHQHAGLAVPDFPLAYGKIWPPTDEEFVHAANAQRIDPRDFHPITAGQIQLHMAHRIGAVLILLLSGACVWYVRRSVSPNAPLARMTGLWFGLISLQAVLGAATVWSNKSAEITTLHVVMGALSLVTGAMLYIATQALSAKAAVRAASGAPGRAAMATI
ncbi:MAG: COX15/CtaA family protein [Verrucomicrobiota bacterium]